MGRILITGVLGLSFASLSSVVVANEPAHRTGYQIENGVRVYKNIPPKTRRVAGVRVIEFPAIPKRTPVQLCGTACNQNQIEAAYERGFQDGFAQKITTRRKHKRSQRRRYSTYLGISPYRRYAYRGIYGRPIRARTARYRRSRR
ncbi:MAG TPA: hypothetical protein ENJ42_02670 [Hellea balneolensis]|uniref:Uncharacterized protein n=1 Tax=Hellea balneolensis TaxID=287478 RepID=A0A7C5LRZ4_9PROT|nr:hypothetical protein [Hellea balneolensis]